MCKLSLDEILILNLNLQCLTLTHLVSLLYGTIIVPVLKCSFTLRSVLFRARSVDILAPFQPLGPTTNQGFLHPYFHRGQVEFSTLGQHFMGQVQYTAAASFFHYSTSRTDRRAIKKIDIQSPPQLQGNSHCQGKMANIIA